MENKVGEKVFIGGQEAVKKSKKINSQCTAARCAGFLGSIAILMKMFWGRIKAFFKGEKYVPPQPEASEEETVDEQPK